VCSSDLVADLETEVVDLEPEDEANPVEEPDAIFLVLESVENNFPFTIIFNGLEREYVNHIIWR